MKEKKGKFFMEIFSMMNKPTEFFESNLSLFRGFLYFLIADLIFTTMTETMVYLNIIPITLKTTFEMTILINFLSILAGLMVISAALIFGNVIMGGKKPFDMLSILLYSITPALLFGWIPFIFIQVLVLFWSMALIMIGVRSKEKLSLRMSVAYPVLFLILVAALTFISQNYIFLGFLK